MDKFPEVQDSILTVEQKKSGLSRGILYFEIGKVYHFVF
jgi:hypothetical protein